MKPLPVVSYTDDDWDIMRAATVRWMFRHNGPFPLASIYVPADRRDAALMLSIAAVQGKARRHFMLWAGVTLELDLRTLAAWCV